MNLLQRRQERLSERSGFALEVALSESVLRQRIGAAEIMADQLDHLVVQATRPNVSLRIVPFDAPSHLGLMSKHFVYLEFPQHLNPALTEEPVVYIEGFTGSLYLDKPTEIDQYQTTRASILQVALDEDDTLRLIRATAREYRS